MNSVDLDVSSVAKATGDAIQATWRPVVVYVACCAVADIVVALIEATGLPFVPTLLDLAFVVGKMWLGFGLAVSALATVRGEARDLRDALPPRESILRLLGLTLLLYLAIGFGFACLVVPGVYLWLLWGQSTWLLLDGRAQSFEAFTQSRLLVAGEKLRILLNLLVLSLGAAVLSIPVALVYFNLGKWIGTATAWLWGMGVGVWLAFMGAVIYARLIEHAPAPDEATAA